MSFKLFTLWHILKFFYRYTLVFLGHQWQFLNCSSLQIQQYYAGLLLQFQTNSAFPDQSFSSRIKYKTLELELEIELKLYKNPQSEKKVWTFFTAGKNSRLLTNNFL